MRRDAGHDETGRPGVTRRSFLWRGFSGAFVLGLGPISALHGCTAPSPVQPTDDGGVEPIGSLGPPDANGLRLPPGFRSRIVAVAGQPPVPGISFVWPLFPDGGATFPTDDGGWIYVANSEQNNGAGGVAALRFRSDGAIVDAYSILTGTSRNCAGGPTPWGTWLSCEEVGSGAVWECDPYTPFSQGTKRPAMGSFNHEAAAVDPGNQRIYLTEDRSSGLLYRFTPDAYPDLSTGALEAAEILAPEGEGRIRPGQVRPLAWHEVPNPNPLAGGVERESHRPLAERATRFQGADATRFNRGEGCWFEGGTMYFATTGDNRVWALNTESDTIEILYDRATAANRELSGVDNVFASPAGDVYVAEDGGNMQIVVLTANGDITPVVEVTNQGDSEIAGPALSPDGTAPLLQLTARANPVGQRRFDV